MEVAYVRSAMYMTDEEFVMWILYHKLIHTSYQTQADTVNSSKKATEGEWNLRPKAKIYVNYGNGDRELVNGSGQCRKTG